MHYSSHSLNASSGLSLATLVAAMGHPQVRGAISVKPGCFRMSGARAARAVNKILAEVRTRSRFTLI